MAFPAGIPHASLPIRRWIPWLALLLWLPPQPRALAAPFSQATLRRMVEGREVFIDKQAARINQTAGRGQQISTGKSRAELLFDQRAIGYLGKNSLITLGQECFRLRTGSVLVNGPQSSCLGNRVLGVRGTTYVLSALEEGGYELAVLHGEALVTPSPDPSAGADTATASQAEAAPNILSRYPRLNPVADLAASAFGSSAGDKTLGQAEGLVLGGAGLFLPLVQREGSQVLYSYSRANTNLDGYWGVSGEVGYRWFDANNQSLNGGLVGYDGWQGMDCFHSQVAVGAQLERNRWQLSALGGIPLDGCRDSLGYATAGLGIPIANLGRESIVLGLSPYLLTNSGDSYGGGRLSLDVPLGPQVNVLAYGQYDDLLQATIGGQVRLRFALGGGFVSDPNARPSAMPSPLPWQSSQRPASQRNPLLIAQAPGQPSGTDPVWDGAGQGGWPGLLAQGGGEDSETVRIKAGERARFDADGRLLSRSLLNAQEFKGLVVTHLKGQKLLPESHAIGKLYASTYNTAAPIVLAVTGLDWYVNARNPLPRARGANILVVPENRLPSDPLPEPPPPPTPTVQTPPPPSPSPPYCPPSTSPGIPPPPC